MHKRIVYAPIKPADCQKVVELHRAAFPATKVSRTIYGAHGVHRYLASLIELPKHRYDHVILAAWDDQLLVGYIHAQPLDGFWHLNEIATLPTHQGKGIGQSLFQKWMGIGVEQGFHSYSLDVEPDSPAFGWYKRVGFDVIQTCWIYEKLLVRPTSDTLQLGVGKMGLEAGTLHLSDWENAQAWQTAYGFSHFRITTEEKEWVIGRLGEKYFRTRELVPPLLEQTLMEIDGRRSLLILSDKPHQTSGLRELGRSVRMRKGSPA
jgi:ribosomal protein S18 acetylase RimI-like enzyme